MIELMLEMAAYLFAMAILGVILGYLFWGWSAARRQVEARRAGFRRGQASAPPDPHLTARLAASEQKAALLRAETERLREDLKAVAAKAQQTSPPPPTRRANRRKRAVAAPVRIGAAGKIRRAPTGPGRGVRRR